MTDRETAGSPLDAGSVEALLRDAASYVPECAAPDDLCSKALARRAARAPTRQHPVALLAAGGALSAAFSVACAIAYMSQPKMPSPALALHDPVAHMPAVEAAAQIARTQIGPEPAIAPRKLERLHPTRRRRLAICHAGTLRHPDRDLTPPARDGRRTTRIAAASTPEAVAARSCWTTEDVQETRYVLVSPGIITEGTGASERATPVLVPLPVNDDFGNIETNADTTDPATNTH